MPKTEYDDVVSKGDSKNTGNFLDLHDVKILDPTARKLFDLSGVETIDFSFTSKILFSMGKAFLDFAYAGSFWGAETPALLINSAQFNNASGDNYCFQLGSSDANDILIGTTDVLVCSGDQKADAAPASTGNLFLSTGSQLGAGSIGPSGLVNLNSGAVTNGVGDSGRVYVSSGMATGGTAKSGDTTVTTGHTDFDGTGASGTLTLNTGDSNTVAGNIVIDPGVGPVTNGRTIVNKGTFQLGRMTTVQRLATVAHPGEMIYDTDLDRSFTGKNNGTWA